ncbi:hypothetical protein [Microvirus mar65]|uniref:Uncharacterized protein n=1 Tax=Microvirus mar65 TaxID=2851202 RepID=A0A8F5RB42_9VIRU|nr:hypothetical protein [Microvirus mar65]
METVFESIEAKVKSMETKVTIPVADLEHIIYLASSVLSILECSDKLSDFSFSFAVCELESICEYCSLLKSFAK